MPYAKICFQLPDLYTYALDEKSKIEVGDLVLASFRNRKLKGVVVEIDNQKPKFKTKPLTEKLDLSLDKKTIELATWIADYYMCPLFKAIRLFLPKYIWKDNSPPTEREIKLIQKDFVPNLRAKKQSEFLEILKNNKGVVNYSEALAKDISGATIKSLEKKEIIEITEKEIDFTQVRKKIDLPKITPTEKQQAVIDEIANKDGVHLLHGIAGSGKSLIYRTLAEERRKKGESSIILVPEISLTPQLCNFFAASFNNSEVAIWHSNLKETEKRKIWHKAKNGQIKIIIGSRSALFVPVQNLGLIVLDEEHEWTYKQDQSPRYDTRTVAKKFNQIFGIKVLFGSATPSTEIYHEADKGKINLVELLERIPSAPKLPSMTTIDLRTETQRKDFKMLSLSLIQKIEETLENKEQVILFLNRRGKASSVTCQDCGTAALCPHCDTALTYHANSRKEILLCHLCGHYIKPLKECPECKGQNLKMLGGGTQKLEAELKDLFPKAKIFRADRDNIQGHSAFEDLHQKIHKKEIDILIGTQMIAQGLDFPGVKLVGIVLADIGMHLPDFRTKTRMYALLSQVAGRSGRHKTQGNVYIQTFNPDNVLFASVQKNDYKKFYEEEILVRREHNLPPFSRMIKITIVNKDKKKTFEKAKSIFDALNKIKSEKDEVYFAPALHPRKHNQYYWNVIIISKKPEELLQKIKLENVRIDVDPIDTV